MHSRTLAVAAIAGAAIAAGCGGGGGGGKPLTKAELTKKGNAICQKAQQKLNAVKQPQKAAEVKPYLEKVLPVAEQSVEDLRALKAPASVKPELDRALRGSEQQAQAFRDFLGKVNNTADVKRELPAFSKRLSELSPDVDASFKKAGLTTCAK